MPTGFQPGVSVEDKVYYCSKGVSDWIGSKKACENNGLILAMPKTLDNLNKARTACGFREIKNRYESNWWHVFAYSAERQSMLQSHFFWIGGSAAGYGSSYKYVDGTDVPANLYLPGQYLKVSRATHFGAQNCLMGNVGLDNNICSFEVQFVCEEKT